MLARSTLNSIESKITEALINNEISQEDFMTIINEEKKYRELKESIRVMNSQRSDVEKVIFIEDGKKIGINEVIKHNEIINNSLKQCKQCKYKMKSYCVRRKRHTKNINPRVSNTSNGKIKIIKMCKMRQ